ncbi:Gfo/Idh/MocA family oxidoreductase [Halomicroarcula sp. F13]|uniref:Gfo/Idh/MocA family oxidoreductase n=1 Tax=Haloarcula rubra TaxID=2487747 RepID=A0AAW4PRD4_9EURY|nr:Gfo/Idh/MocA family oxidoreductase [Halomicroarcula rubra]MBX0322852.1 Gfo/Idh/MocA family oxidoreductase [Halomicroarcula rubra]
MTVRIGAIGLGGLGRRECRQYAGFDDVELVAGVDVAAEARTTFEDSFDRPAYESVGELLAGHADELDAVSVCTPHTLHHDHAMAALERDLHAFVEKPLTTELATARELVETAADRDRVLQVGFQRHFDPLFAELRRIVQSGTIGTPHTVNAYLGQRWIAEHEGTWRTTPSLSGGGQLFDSGTHLVDATLWVLDAEPTAVTGVVDDRGHDVDVNSALAATLDADGRRVTASVCVSGDGTDIVPDDGISIWGTEGHVSLAGGDLTVTTPDSTREVHVDGDRDFETLTERKLRNFVDAVEGTADSVVTGEYGLAVTAFLEAAYEATQRGETVHVEDLTGR